MRGRGRERGEREKKKGKGDREGVEGRREGGWNVGVVPELRY